MGVPSLIGLALTDTNGRYALEMIEPGTYYVVAGRVDAPSYYPGVGTMPAAQSILLGAGARISGIDFKTFEPPTFIASGRVVLKPDQQLVAGSRMILLGSGTRESAIKADGSFEFTRLSPGSFSLRLEPASFTLAMAVTVVDKNVSGIEFTVPSVVLVNGIVAMDDDSDPPIVSVSFVDISQSRVLDITSRRSFSLPVPEGDFRTIVKRLPNGYRVKSFMANGVDLLSQNLKLSQTAGAPMAVHLTLESVQTVPFAGQAVSSQGVLQPVRGIRMENGDGVEPLEGRVQPDGSFVFDRIAPGEYTAAIFAGGSEELKSRVIVPPGGRRDAQIVIPELRQSAIRLTIDPSVPAAARVTLTLRFVEDGGSVTTAAVDSTSGVQFSLREGQYRVSATLRETITGSGRTRVTKMSSGNVDLLTSPLNVSGRNPEEIQVTIGR